MQILGLLFLVFIVIVIYGTMKSQAQYPDIWFLAWLKDSEKWGWAVAIAIIVVGAVVASLLGSLWLPLGYVVVIVADGYFGYRLVKYVKG